MSEEVTTQCEKSPSTEQADVVEKEETLDELINEERVAQFIRGEITLAKLEGITAEEIYGIADMGYTLLEQGKIDDAQTIFEGLEVYNPYDAYFHSVLGSIYQQKGEEDNALEEYAMAIELYPEDINSCVNRGEILLNQGKVDEAAEHFKRAIELDPDGKDPMGLRAQALASVTAEVIKGIAEQKGVVID